MTKTDIMKDFLKKAVLPVVEALFLYSIFSRIFVDNGTMDLFLIWLACGVPFGIGKMFTLIPIGFGMSSSSLLPGNNTDLPLETGEKQVSTVFRSARSFGIVVLPSTVPVISAVSSLKISFANLLTFAKR